MQAAAPDAQQRRDDFLHFNHLVLLSRRSLLACALVCKLLPLLGLLAVLNPEMVSGSRLVLAALIVTAAIPAVAFALGGIAKLDDPLLAAQFIGHVLSLRLDHAFDLTRAVAVCELLLAAGICLSLGRRRWPAYGGMCLLAFFIGMLLVVQLRDPRVASCGCFGGLMGTLFLRSLWTQIGIDTGLMMLLAIHVVLTSVLMRRSASADAAGQQPADAAASRATSSTGL